MDRETATWCVTVAVRDAVVGRAVVGRAVVGRAVVGVCCSGACRGGVCSGGACSGGVWCWESLPKQPFLPGKGRETKFRRPEIST